ncbi:MAG: NAD-dependent malic enzyme [Gammaproteobacteria bacterium]|nr:NAD-dependent malic enzyme [Gammaproteobacteria bacterium]
MDYEHEIDEQKRHTITVKLTDYALMMNPLLNKGMAFSAEERDLFNLWGLLPPRQIDLATQRKRSWEACQSKQTDVEKYIYLRDLQDSNETLFYSLLCEHIETLMPIVYTPTVGFGCQRYSHIYRRPRGIFISYPNQDHIEKILENSRFDRVKVIVVSDGERILGLGDQGAGGMGIPIGKLALYTACAGVYPGYTLPILLDSGTNNPELQNDPLYIGWQHERIRGQAYDGFIEKFILAVEKRFPKVLLQWEDFSRENAGPLLDRYRDRLCSFNDDIQGTAAVAAATLLSASRVTKIPLKEQRIIIFGAGSAGCGIARLLQQLMVSMGLTVQEAKQCFYLVDRAGLLLKRQKNLLPFQKEFARDENENSAWQSQQDVTLEKLVRDVKPTILLGVSGQHGAFHENLVREMAKHCARPAIFPLSNPDANCEANPQDLIEWTEGRAIIGTGSPFPHIHYRGQERRVDQTNNCYIFPGLGLALIALKATSAPEILFIAAAKALADYAAEHLTSGDNLLPPLKEIRSVSHAVAVAVAKQIIASGLNKLDPPDDLAKYLSDYMWQPVYVPYRK